MSLSQDALIVEADGRARPKTISIPEKLLKRAEARAGRNFSLYIQQLLKRDLAGQMDAAHKGRVNGKGA